jgi:hypothetical protein
MKLHIEIEIENDAFVHHFRPEIVYVLQRYCYALESGNDISKKLLDSNGNSVGFARIEK